MMMMTTMMKKMTMSTMNIKTYEHDKHDDEDGDVIEVQLPAEPEKPMHPVGSFVWSQKTGKTHRLLRLFFFSSWLVQAKDDCSSGSFNSLIHVQENETVSHNSSNDVGVLEQLKIHWNLSWVSDWAVSKQHCWACCEGGVNIDWSIALKGSPWHRSISYKQTGIHVQIWCSSSIWVNCIIIHQSNNHRKSGHLGYWPKLHCLFFFVTSRWFIQHGIHHLGIWDVQKNTRKKHTTSIGWELTSSKWSYDPYKWPYRWVTGFCFTPISGVMVSCYTTGEPLRPTNAPCDSLQQVPVAIDSRAAESVRNSQSGWWKHHRALGGKGGVLPSWELTCCISPKRQFWRWFSIFFWIIQCFWDQHNANVW